MTTKILKKTSSAIFLAIVLIVGTFAVIFPSFMIGAYAQQYYGMDQRYNSYQPEYGTDNKYNSYEQDYGKDNKYNSYEPEYGTDYGMDNYDKKPYGKDNSYDTSKDSSSSVTVKKIKCNNINANLNGDIEVGSSPALSALATETQGADEGTNGANSGNDGRGGDGRPSGDDSNSRFICINNNDNTVVEGEEPDLVCEECFAANSNLQTAIEDFLVDFDAITIDAGPLGIFVLGPGTDTIEQLCDMIESSASLYGIPFSDALLKLFL